jgi:hypothetical protein
MSCLARFCADHHDFVHVDAEYGGLEAPNCTKLGELLCAYRRRPLLRL